ncbi:MAG: pyridoxal phosphate-dependent aminotransferase [bacterium]|nr:pyridoxal phosphate-dependent aminotransferase [bacterium]
MKRPEGSLISYFSNRVKKQGGINLAQGIPGYPPPEPLLDCLEAYSRDASKQQYAPGIGNFRLLEQVSRKLSETAPIDKDRLLILQGATEGVFLTFFYLTTILPRPFSALSFDPVYESYPKLADMFGVPFEYADFNKNLEVDFENLEKVIKEKQVKVVFIASPGNPLGKVWNEDEMARMMELSRKYGFYIIFDAVYKDISFGGTAFNPLQFGYEKLFYVDSFSKMLSITGWRIGYIVTSAEHMTRIRGLHDYTGLCAPTMMQAAIARYLEENEYGKEYIASVKARSGKAFGYLRGQMEALGFEVADVDGGYFLWARLPVGHDDAFVFVSNLYEKVKLAMVPGENFSLTKKNYVRVNIAAEMPVMEAAAQRLREFFA